MILFVLWFAPVISGKNNWRIVGGSIPQAGKDLYIFV